MLKDFLLLLGLLPLLHTVLGGRVKRVVGGRKAAPHKYPWQAYLEVVDSKGDNIRYRAYLETGRQAGVPGAEAQFSAPDTCSRLPTASWTPVEDQQSRKFSSISHSIKFLL